MSKIISLAVGLLSLSGALVNGASLPVSAGVKTNAQEVVPGPGLPSLAELNITSAELYASIYDPSSILFLFFFPPPHFAFYLLPKLSHKKYHSNESFNLSSLVPAPKSNTLPGLHADFHPFCGGGRGDSAAVDDVIACFNYLTHLGHKACVLPPRSFQVIEFCRAGTANILGNNPTYHQTSSYW